MKANEKEVSNIEIFELLFGEIDSDLDKRNKCSDICSSIHGIFFEITQNIDDMSMKLKNDLSNLNLLYDFFNNDDTRKIFQKLADKDSCNLKIMLNNNQPVTA